VLTTFVLCTRNGDPSAPKVIEFVININENTVDQVMVPLMNKISDLPLKSFKDMRLQYGETNYDMGYICGHL